MMPLNFGASERLLEQNARVKSPPHHSGGQLRISEWVGGRVRVCSAEGVRPPGPGEGFACATRDPPDGHRGAIPAATVHRIALGAGAILASGCSRTPAKSSVVAAPEPTPAATSKPGHGLQLSPAGAAFIGLKTAAVGARDFGDTNGIAAIPAEALLRTAKGDFVFVANGGWFLRTPVKIGAVDDGWIGVPNGLYEGDNVVTGGVRALWLAETQAVNGGVGCADGY